MEISINFEIPLQQRFVRPLRNICYFTMGLLLLTVLSGVAGSVYWLFRSFPEHQGPMLFTLGLVELSFLCVFLWLRPSITRGQNLSDIVLAFFGSQFLLLLAYQAVVKISYISLWWPVGWYAIAVGLVFTLSLERKPA